MIFLPLKAFEIVLEIALNVDVALLLSELKALVMPLKATSNFKALAIFEPKPLMADVTLLNLLLIVDVILLNVLEILFTNGPRLNTDLIRLPKLPIVCKIRSIEVLTVLVMALKLERTTLFILEIDDCAALAKPSNMFFWRSITLFILSIDFVVFCN